MVDRHNFLGNPPFQTKEIIMYLSSSFLGTILKDTDHKLYLKTYQKFSLLFKHVSSYDSYWYVENSKEIQYNK